MKLIQKYRLHLLLGAAGALGGYLYWHYIGCNSGTCPITAKWANSTLYGALIGVLIGDSFRKRPVNEKK